MLKTKLALYEDLLYQVHTYHHIVDLVNKVNSGENVEFYLGELPLLR